jgi:hypothetical protein
MHAAHVLVLYSLPSCVAKHLLHGFGTAVVDASSSAPLFSFLALLKREAGLHDAHLFTRGHIASLANLQTNRLNPNLKDCTPTHRRGTPIARPTLIDMQIHNCIRGCTSPLKHLDPPLLACRLESQASRGVPGAAWELKILCA